MSNPSQAGPSSNQAQHPPPDQLQKGGSASGSARHAEEQARKDRTLTEFMLMLDEYEPMVRHPNQLVHARDGGPM
jgi:transcription initiation factor TFIID subunit 10